MLARSVFADNLRRACLRYRTIAEICEGIGINRQQFNKYLSGSALPNPVTLERICKFLNIELGALFMNPEQGAEKIRNSDTRTGEARASEARGGRSGTHLNAASFAVFEGNTKLDLQVNDLPVGEYFCYSQYPKLPGMVIRSLVHVWQAGEEKRFVRVTSFPSATNKSKRVGGGRHAGKIFANQTEIYFLGLNRYSPGQMSLMTIERANVSNNHFFTGMMLTRSHARPMCLGICMVHQNENRTLKDFIRRVGLIHESDLVSTPTVLAAINRDMAFA